MNDHEQLSVTITGQDDSQISRLERMLSLFCYISEEEEGLDSLKMKVTLRPHALEYIRVITMYQRIMPPTDTKETTDGEKRG